MKRILYIRNFAKEINLEHYNSQEIGLCKHFVDHSYDCDIIYYTKGKEEIITVYENNGKRLRIKTQKAIKVFSNAIYMKTLLSLGKYDVIILSEFHQIMSIILPLIKRDNIYIYHGTYKDENPLIRYIPKFIINRMDRYYNRIFTKSVLAKEYLEGKGFNHVEVVGVGLDTSKFNRIKNKSNLNSNIRSFGRYLLYIGEFCERKNTLFLLDVIAKLRDKEVKLVLVGHSSDEYKIKLLNRISELCIKDRVIFVGKVTQDDLPSYYEGAEIFLLPSNYEIFGMVLLECMYFNTLIISSRNGGSTTLFGRDNQDIIISEIKTDKWADKIDKMLIDIKSDLILQSKKIYSKGLKINNWNYISELMLKYFE